MLNYANLSFKTVPTTRAKHTKGYIHWPSNEHDRMTREMGIWWEPKESPEPFWPQLFVQRRGMQMPCPSIEELHTQMGTQEHVDQARVVSYEGGMKVDKRIFVTVLGCSPSGLSSFISLRKKNPSQLSFPSPVLRCLACAKAAESPIHVSCCSRREGRLGCPSFVRTPRATQAWLVCMQHSLTFWHME